MSLTPVVQDQEGTGDRPARRWAFGTAVLDERSLEVTVSGEPVYLERKSLEVLLCLLHHAGEVVTKDELLEAVWPGRILTETVLAKCIAKLREALGDDDQQIIKTAYGYGYRLIAPVTVEASVAAALPRFDFKLGDHPPLRPLWSLVEKLGRGGHGEAWLARHDKTREQRVYKFALDGTSLPSLKREITLYRYLRDALGERGDLVRVLDWNLEEQPYFLELEYAGARNLEDWLEAQGGIASVALDVRLEIIAKAADALAAAHSVGVLHKDLKPTNVLILEDGGKPAVKLTDFGSGGVLDPERLDALGITKLGFTGNTKPTDPSATPLYVAPEIQAGQPATVQGDVYALGIMLYQLVVGDLKRPLASGWEHEIEDEFLREDIAKAAAGNPLRRLGDAARLARRLRTLDERRHQRAGEKAAQSELRQLRMTLLRKRARRRWMQATLAVLLIGTVTTATLYVGAEKAKQQAIDARNEAVRAAAITQAVSDFLNKDLLAGANPWKEMDKDLTVREVLNRAADQAPNRFADQPEVAAHIHATVGETYAWLGQYEPALVQLEKAAAQFEKLYGAASEQRLAALGELSRTLTNMGRVQDGCGVAQSLLTAAAAGHDTMSHPVLQARLMVARCVTLKGDLPAATTALRQLIADVAGSETRDEAIIDEAQLWLARAVMESADYPEAESLVRSLVDSLTQKYGGRHIRTALQRFFLSFILMEQEKFEESERVYREALNDIRSAAGFGFDHRFPLEAQLGNLLLQQGRLDEAVAALTDGRRRFEAIYSPHHPNAAVFAYLLGEAFKRQGRLDRAVGTLRGTLAATPPTRNHILLIGLESSYARITLADSLRLQGRHRDAWKALEAMPEAQLRLLPAQHPILGELRRVQGLLSLDEGQHGKARAALEEARALFRYRYGDNHWRTKRAREELARVPASAAEAAGSS